MKECHSNSFSEKAVGLAAAPIERRHWRGLEELAASPQFHEMLER